MSAALMLQDDTVTAVTMVFNRRKENIMHDSLKRNITVRFLLLAPKIKRTTVSFHTYHFPAKFRNST